jgi:adenylate cyclase
VRKTWRWWALVAAAAVAAFGLWRWGPWAPDIEPASMARMAMPLPDRPSLVVLPFEGRDAGPDGAFLADGLSEEIATALAGAPGLFVIDRDSAFIYRDQPDAIRQAAEELGVRYVLMGTVSLAGADIQLTARLVDAVRGRFLWDQSYTDHLELARQVAESLEVEPAATGPQGATEPEAHLLYLRGLGHFRRLTSGDNAEARRLWKAAIEADPGYARAWAGLAAYHETAARRGWSANPARSFAAAAEAARKALALDSGVAEAHALLGALALADGDHDRALASAERAVDLAPHDANAKAGLAAVLVLSGDPERAMALLRQAMRRNPFYPAWYLGELGHALRLTRLHDEAIAVLTAWRDRVPRSPTPHLQLAIALAQAGRSADARAAMTAFLERLPGFSVKQLAGVFPYRGPADLARTAAAARDAGLPE